jgi:small-conductance mechanosensitive channel
MKHKKSLWLFILSIILLLPPLLFAGQTSPKPLTGFDPIAANKYLDQLNSKTIPANQSVPELEAIVLNLTTMRDRAHECIQNSQNELNQLQTINTEIAPAINNGTVNQASNSNVVSKLTNKNIAVTQAVTQSVSYVDNKRQMLNVRLSGCQLFFMRSKDAIDHFAELAEKLVATRLMRIDHPAWQSFIKFIPLLKESISQWDQNTFLVSSGLLLLNIPWMVLFTFLLLVVLILAKKIKNHIQAQLNVEAPSTFTQQFQQSLLLVLRKYCYWIGIALVVGSMSLLFSLEQGEINSLLRFGLLFIGFLLFQMLCELFFVPPKPGVGISHLPEAIAIKLNWRLKLLSLISLVGLTIYFLMDNQPFAVQFVHLLRTIFVTFFAITLFSIVWLINHNPMLRYQYRALRLGLEVTFNILLLVILLSEWFGFHNFARYLVNGIAASVFVLFISWFVRRMLDLLFHSLLSGEYLWQKRFRYLIGVQRYQSLLELTWIKLVLDSFIAVTVITALLRIWIFAALYWRDILEIFFYGFQFAGIEINLSRILFAILIFMWLLLLSRWLRHRITRRRHGTMENGSREALATIVGYIAVGISFLLGLLIAGVNFAGLAIIAGALSVGIGFGLQNIVNNFLSGVILLIERPIKIGDRISVGNTEGFVKKISIRSTQIQNLQRADVIVPNAELITNQVTNYMLQDLNCRFMLNVGVAYGSDTHLVQKTLLEVAQQHHTVLHDEENKPLVIFRSFGDSSLHFELWCTVKDINTRYQTISDINFEIDRLFRELNIEMPFPQREVRIRNQIDDNIKK